MTNRKRLEKIYGNLYRVVNGHDLNVCIYCGSDASIFDHCPPLSAIEGIDIEKYKNNGGRLRLYPSCRQCNALLGDYSETNMLERISYLIFKYEKRISGLKYWSDKELDMMGFRLRQYIKGRQCRYEILNNKLVRLSENSYNELYLKYQ